MKKLLNIIVLGFAMNSILLSQSADQQDISKAEMFTNKPQAVIEKQFIEIGYVDMIELRLMKCKNITTGESINAVRFEYQTTNQVLSQTKLAIIDEDEIENLSAALKHIINSFGTEKEVYTEITFRSRSGFVTGAYFSPDTKKWMPYIQMNKNDLKSTVVIPKDEFAAFQELLIKAKNQIKSND